MMIPGAKLSNYRVDRRDGEEGPGIPGLAQNAAGPVYCVALRSARADVRSACGIKDPDGRLKLGTELATDKPTQSLSSEAI